MHFKQKHALTILLAAALLTGCSLPTRPTATPIINQAVAGTIVASTLAAIQTNSPAVTSALTNAPQLESTVMDSPVPSITPSPVPSITTTPTITPTYSTPQLLFDSNVNCREGPSTDFRVVIVIQSGHSVEPIGVQGNYWLVRSPSGKGTCWVVNDFATPSGSTWTVATVTAPPPPTLQAPPAPAWSKWNYTCNYAANGYSVTMNMSWSDLATNLGGYRVYRNGQAIATLGPDTTSYTDQIPLENGKTLTYYIEAYKDTATAQSSTINASCQ